MEAHFLLVIAAILADLVLSGRWAEPYFRYGLPVFWRRISVPATRPISADLLETACEGDWGPRLLFREMGSGDIAFREAAFTLPWHHYSPVMHGVIFWRVQKREAVILGQLKWWVPALVFSVIVEEWRHILLLTPMVFAILGLLYALQARRYLRVSKTIFALANGHTPS